MIFQETVQKREYRPPNKLYLLTYLLTISNGRLIKEGGFV